MPTLDRDGVKIYYEIHGSGPALLLTHGYGASAQMWRGQIDPLARHHQLIIWDMRGHGQSDDPDDASRYSEALTVGDMAALLDIAGARRAIIGGLSLGGVMTLAFHHAHSERCAALMLIDTGPGFRNDLGRQNWNERALRRAERYERDGLSYLKSDAAASAHAQHRSAQGLAHAARGMLVQNGSDLMDSLPSIRVPTLVLVGSNDVAFVPAADYMAKKIAGAQKIVLADAGHMSNIDQPQAFNDAVGGFVDGLKG